MSNEVLNSLLKEYSQKKLNAELDLERRKQNLYKLIPRLEEIDNELNNFAINTAKNILNNSSDSSSLKNLKDRISDLKKEKELILLQNNYSLDYLKPFYECKICNDTGFVLDKNYKTTMCNCLKQKLLDISFNKSNMSNLKKENFNNFNELIFSDEVDLAKYRFNISPRRNISNIKNKCIEFINNFDNPDYKNLLFVGSTGLR
jgi:istB domain protein ATP-binding protein